MMIELTERDEFLLDFLWHVRYAYPRQINQYVFPGTARCTVTNRLHALEEAGLILKHNKPMHKADDRDRKLVTIARRGIAVLNQRNANKQIRSNDVPKTDQGSLSKSCILHDLALVDVGIRLSEELPEAAWISEHGLRIRNRQKAHVRSRTPDALFTYTVGGQREQLVVENVRIPYGRERFMEALQLLVDEYPDAVQLWVGANQASTVTMFKWAHNHRGVQSRRQNIVFCLHQRLIEDGLQAPLVHLEGKVGEDHVLLRAATEAEAAREVDEAGEQAELTEVAAQP